MTDEGDWVFDPFSGVGTTIIAALMHNRRAIGSEIVPEYLRTAKQRIRLAQKGKLRIRPMQRPVYDPYTPGRTIPPQFVEFGASRRQLRLLEKEARYKAGGQKA